MAPAPVALTPLDMHLAKNGLPLKGPMGKGMMPQGVFHSPHKGMMPPHGVPPHMMAMMHKGGPPQFGHHFVERQGPYWLFFDEVISQSGLLKA